MRVRADFVFWTFAAAFGLFSAAAGARLIHPVDARLLALAQSRVSPVLDSVGDVFSVLGEVQYTSVAAIALVTGLFVASRRALALRFTLVFVLTGLVEIAMKFFLPAVPVDEETARSMDPTPLVHLDYPYPYPSGHMLRSVLLLGMIFVLWPNRYARSAVVVLLAGMAATRMYLGVHWASDVVGGSLLGVAGVAWTFMQGKRRS